MLISYNDAATSTAEAGIYGVRTSGYSQFAMKPIPKDGAVGDVLGIYGEERHAVETMPSIRFR